MTNVGLVQINNSFSQANYLPLSTGLLQAYASEHCHNKDRLHFLPHLYSRQAVADSVKLLAGAHVVGFSTYVWNVKVSLAIAGQLKDIDPQVLIVFGGPQVPDQPEDFMRQNPAVDICVHGEGEVVFAKILEELDGGEPNWENVPSISWRRDGELVRNPKANRLRDLNVIPSPFLNGVFQDLMKANPEQQWLGLWETNRGCPFSCTFCDWGSATQAKVFQFDLERLKQEIDWFSQQKVEFIFCCDANFGILPRDLEIAQQVAQIKGKTGYPQALSVQNTKNATERAYQVQKTLADHGLNKGVTLSMQSMDPHTLKSIKRDNISLTSYQELQRRFTQDRIETYSDMILGLPGETYDTFLDGIATIISNGQHNRIQFNNLAILPNAEMGNPEYQRKYSMETVVTRIVNIHGSLAENPDGLYEEQDLVVATASMGREDWVRTRAFCWMTAFLYFDKVFQIPLLLAHQQLGLPVRDLLGAFRDFSAEEYPVLHELEVFFRQSAQEIQQGAPEYIHSPECLDIYWPTDEFALIGLARRNQLKDFYQEATRVLQNFLKHRDVQDAHGLIAEAAHLNQNLLKLPFVSHDQEMDLSTNLWEIYGAALQGQRVEVVPGHYRLSIDRHSQSWNTWEDWYRQVVWYGNKKGAYLYSNLSIERQLEGHF